MPTVYCWVVVPTSPCMCGTVCFSCWATSCCVTVQVLYTSPLQAMGWSCPLCSTRPHWMGSTTLLMNWSFLTLLSTTGPTLLAMATPMGKESMMQEALASSTLRWVRGAAVHASMCQYDWHQERLMNYALLLILIPLWDSCVVTTVVVDMIDANIAVL